MLVSTEWQKFPSPYYINFFPYFQIIDSQDQKNLIFEADFFTSSAQHYE